MHGIVHFHFSFSYSREGAHWYVSDALGKKTYQDLKAKTKDQFLPASCWLEVLGWAHMEEGYGPQDDR